MRARTSCRSSSGATRRATTWATRPRQQVPHCSPHPLPPPSPTSHPRSQTATHPNHPTQPHAREHTSGPAPPDRPPLLPTAGQKEQEANNWLEKRYKTDANPALSYDDTVQLALACLQNVLGSDLKADDVEVRRPLPPPKPEAQALPHGVACSGRDARARGGCGKLRGRSGRGPSRKHPLPPLPGRCLDAETTSVCRAQCCVVRNSNMKFTRLTNDEVETQLTALAERDDDLLATDK